MTSAGDEISRWCQNVVSDMKKPSKLWRNKIQTTKLQWRHRQWRDLITALLHRWRHQNTTLVRNNKYIDLRRQSLRILNRVTVVTLDISVQMPHWNPRMRCPCIIMRKLPMVTWWNRIVIMTASLGNNHKINDVIMTSPSYHVTSRSSPQSISVM